MSDQDRLPDPDAPVVVVFQTTEAGLLPLVRAALEQAGIDYAVKNTGLSSFIIGDRATATVGSTAPPFQVMVLEDDEVQAREALEGLEAAGAGEPLPPATQPAARMTASAPVSGAGGVDLTDAETGAPIGTLTAAQFDNLASQLERESNDDRDYYVDEATVVMLEEAGADAEVLSLLRGALGTRPGIDVRWKRN